MEEDKLKGRERVKNQASGRPPLPPIILRHKHFEGEKIVYAAYTRKLSNSKDEDKSPLPPWLTTKRVLEKHMKGCSIKGGENSRIGFSKQSLLLTHSRWGRTYSSCTSSSSSSCWWIRHVPTEMNPRKRSTRNMRGTRKMTG